MKVLQNGIVVRFSKMTCCWCAFSWDICNQNGHFMKCIQSSSSQCYDGIHRSWEVIKSWEEQWPKTQTKWQVSPYVEEDCVWKSWNCCSKGDSRTQYSSWRPCFHQKQSDENFTDPASTVELKLLNLWLQKTTVKGEKDGVTIMKLGRLMIGNT